MSTNITKALEQMNAAMGRTYTIQEREMLFTLCIPTGGEYPACDSQAMVERLLRMTIAAQGRIR